MVLDNDECDDECKRSSPIQDQWYSSSEAACYLSITTNALRIWVHRRRIKAYKLGARLRFRKEDIDAALAMRSLY